MIIKSNQQFQRWIFWQSIMAFIGSVVLLIIHPTMWTAVLNTVAIFVVTGYGRAYDRKYLDLAPGRGLRVWVSAAALGGAIFSPIYWLINQPMPQIGGYVASGFAAVYTVLVLVGLHRMKV